MIGRKYTIVLWLSLIIIIIGTVKVNVELNRINGKAYDEETYKNVYTDSGHKADAYAELQSIIKGVQLKCIILLNPLIPISIHNKSLYTEIFSRNNKFIFLP